MAVESQSYISCDECGKLLVDENGKTVYGETDDCVRSEAYDMGWQTNVVDSNPTPDLCTDCKKPGNA